MATGILPSLVSAKEVDEGLNLEGDDIVWKPFPTTEGYVTNDQGLVACRIYETIRAQKLWNAIMSSTYDFAEPGFILIDQVNKNNNNWFSEDIRATNPCGEQPLPPYELPIGFSKPYQICAQSIYFRGLI